MGSAGACRREELVNMTLNDIEDKDTILIVKIPITKTNTTRTFIVNSERDLQLYRNYLQLRPPHINHKRLFIFFRNGKCSTQVVGLHSVGKAPSKIASYLKLENPGEFTGHCFRRSSATLLVEGGGDIINLKRHGGWKSSTVAEGYLEDSIKNKVDIANKIHAGCSKNNIQETKFVSTTTKNVTIPNISDTSSLQIFNVHNCTFNINIQK